MRCSFRDEDAGGVGCERGRSRGRARLCLRVGHGVRTVARSAAGGPSGASGRAGVGLRSPTRAGARRRVTRSSVGDTAYRASGAASRTCSSGAAATQLMQWSAADRSARSLFRPRRLRSGAVLMMRGQVTIRVSVLRQPAHLAMPARSRSWMCRESLRLPSRRARDPTLRPQLEGLPWEVQPKVAESYLHGGRSRAFAALFRS